MQGEGRTTLCEEVMEAGASLNFHTGGISALSPRGEIGNKAMEDMFLIHNLGSCVLTLLD